MQPNEARGCRIQSDFVKTPGPHRAGRSEIHPCGSQLDNGKRRLFDRHHEMRATLRNINEAEQSARSSVFNLDCTCIAVGIESPEGKRDEGCASMQLSAKFDRGFDVAVRKR